LLQTTLQDLKARVKRKDFLANERDLVRQLTQKNNGTVENSKLFDINNNNSLSAHKLFRLVKDILTQGNKEASRFLKRYVFV